MSNKLSLKGKIKAIFDTQTFSSGFSKREFVITTEEQYPQDVKFEVVKDKVSLLDRFVEGEAVEVSFNARGNEWGGNFYVSLQAWKIDPYAAAPAPDSGEDRPF
jgi:single-strand DNA-binding protein